MEEYNLVNDFDFYLYEIHHLNENEKDVYTVLQKEGAAKFSLDEAEKISKEINFKVVKY